MVKNRLQDLNMYLFDQLERLSDKKLEGEKLDAEIKRTKAITDTTQVVINNAQLNLNVHKFLADNGIKTDSVDVLMISGGEK